MPLETLTPPPHSDLDSIEWLLSAGQGGFAMGTASGVPSRRYHGLLIASLRPPVQRIMALSLLAERISIGTAPPISLWRARFRPGDVHPAEPSALVRFEKDTTCRWTYRVSHAGGHVDITKHLALVRDANAVVVKYTIHGSTSERVRLQVRPLIALRDFHALILRDTARDWFRTDIHPGSPSRLVVQSPQASLYFRTSPEASLTLDDQWWYNFQYNQERDRGYDFLEDLYCPGAFELEFSSGAVSRELSILATTDAALADQPIPDPESIRREQAARLETFSTNIRNSLADGTRASSSSALGSHLDTLVAAADDFVVRRGGVAGLARRSTIIAGYPWFADWGRDSMISLPGLLLVTGRHDEAREVLRVFAAARRNGLVPNLFDDYSGDAHYNTVDASLWFIHAACEYLRASGDRTTFFTELLPACKDIIVAFQNGTDFAIRMDPADALISAGTEHTQLTWMDAKRDGVVFTPRQGKAVEINALWHHALRSLAEACIMPPAGGNIAARLASTLVSAVRSTAGVVAGSKADHHTDPAFSQRCSELASRVSASFRKAFWNEARQSLHDCLIPTPDGWRAEPEVRPNQLFAVSLRFSPLETRQQQAVVQTCTRELLTPGGVRTLWREDPRYRGRYRGRMFDRDAAYHNGTAWPWLLGPMAEATLRAGNFSPDACAAADRVLKPIYSHLNEQCLGQIAEVFDGDHEPPLVQQPGGCPAQAWSVAEALRVGVLIAQARAGTQGL